MGRKYDITKSIESTTITFKEFDLSKGGLIDSVVEVKDFDNTMTDEKVIALLRNKYGHVNALQVISKATTNAYYGMSKETFVAHAGRTNNKDGRNLIKRTLNAYNVSYMYYDMKTGGYDYANVFLDKIDESEIFTLKGLNTVRKMRENEDTRIVFVNDFDRVSEMYGMDVSTFIKYADVISSDEMESDDGTNE